MMARNIGKPNRRLVTKASMICVVLAFSLVESTNVSASAPSINPYFSLAMMADTSSPVRFSMRASHRSRSSNSFLWSGDSFTIASTSESCSRSFYGKIARREVHPDSRVGLDGVLYHGDARLDFRAEIHMHMAHYLLFPFVYPYYGVEKIVKAPRLCATLWAPSALRSSRRACGSREWHQSAPARRTC